jgi:gliding motility-associated-like protein
MTLDVYNTIPCGTGTELYFWSPTIGLDNPNVRNPLLTVQSNQASTMYYLVYDDGCGCQTQDSFMIQVSDINVPNTIVNKYQCNTTDGEITISPVGGYSPYQFSIDSGSNFFVSNFFNNLDIGTYDVIVRDSVGCWSPLKIDTILDPGAPIIDSFRLQDVSCFAANDGEIEIFGSGGLSPYTFSNDSGSTYQVSNLFTNLAFGNYFIQMRDDSLCRSLPQEVLIGSNGQMFVDSIIKTDLLCFEENFGQISIYGRGGTPPLTYSINNGSTYQSSNIFNNLAAGTYIVYIRDSKGCLTDPQVVNLTQPAKLQLSMNVVNDTCFEACGGRSSVIASGGVIPYIFNWYGHGSNSNTSNNLCAGVYQFRVTDNNGCFIDTAYVVNEPSKLIFDSVVYDNISCNGNTDGFIHSYVSGGRQPYNYSINGGQSYTTNPNFNGLDAGTYQVIVYDSGFRCMIATTVTLVEPSVVNLTVPISYHKICVSNCINLVANASGGNGSPYTYNWIGLSGNTSTVPACPENDTIYAVYAEDNRGCVSNVELIKVELYDSLKVIGSQDVGICPGDSIDISAIALGGMGTGYNYTWSPSQTVLNPFSNNTLVYPFVTQDYIIKLTDKCGSPAVYDTIKVTVYPLPNPDFISNGSVEGCEPFDINLINTTNNVQFCSWNIGNRSSATGFTISILDLKAGSYDVTLNVRTVDGCLNKVNKKDFIRVFPKPVAKFSMSPNPTKIFNTNISFIDESFSDIVMWNWDFSGLGFSDAKNPKFWFDSDTGNFIIRLNVVDINGCEDQTEEILRINPEYNIFIPTAFTPNGDGLNDVFTPIGLGLDPQKYHFMIFDRGGDLIFESKTLLDPWDGSVRNKTNIAPNGVYIWKVFANSLYEYKNYEYIGVIHLIR